MEHLGYDMYQKYSKMVVTRNFDRHAAKRPPSKLEALQNAGSGASFETTLNGQVIPGEFSLYFMAFVWNPSIMGSSIKLNTFEKLRMILCTVYVLIAIRGISLYTCFFLTSLVDGFN